MKTLQYQGFTKPSTCQYGIGDLQGKKAVVFVQGPLTNTSITNMIEVLASRVLCDDLIGTHPRDVRFFEHYPRALQPLAEWQEVTFEEHVELDPKLGLVAKLLELVRGPSEPTAWAVDKPLWSALRAGDVPSELLKIIAS